MRNPIETQNIKGDYQILGNTVLCVKNHRGNCYDYTGSLSNSEINLKWIDVDSVNHTFNNSSQATIDIPPNSKVVWAGLYSQGYISDTSLNQEQSIALLKDPIELTVNGITNKILSIPENIDFTSDDSRNTYATFATISELEGKLGSEINGVMTTANIKAYEGKESSGLGNFGAWTVVIIYKSDDANTQLKNISIYDGYKLVRSGSSIDIPIEGFTTPGKGAINAKTSIFVGEGDANINGDTLLFNDHTIGYIDGNGKNNAFYSHISGFTRNPAYSNNEGIDIQNYNIGETGYDLVSNNDTNASLTFTSTGDFYYPSLVAFSVDLYIPRVCYYIDTIADSDGANIFEDGKFTEDIQSDTEYTFNFWISNMKKDANDTDLEAARYVQIYLNMTDFSYTPESSYIYNIGTSAYQEMSDSYNDDLGEYSENKSTWRVGDGANNLEGGSLDVANGFNDTTNIAKINIKGKITTESNITNINLLDLLQFKASFKTDTITISSDNAQLIEECQDLNTSVNILDNPNGLYNAVQTSFTGSTDPLNMGTSVDPVNWLPTQVVNKPFTLTIVSLDSSSQTTLTNSESDVNVSIINTPVWTGDSAIDSDLCHNTVSLNTAQVLEIKGSDKKEATFISPIATRSASIKITYDASHSTCSRDVFAIRPNKFVLIPAATDDFELLSAGKMYYMSLVAPAFGTNNPSPEYNLTNIDSSVLSISSTKYDANNNVDAGLNGMLTFTPNGPFNIIDGISDSSGISEVVTMKYSDVGLINISIQDRDWARVDLENGDTNADCSAIGAYVCGDVNTTFIPDHFSLTNAHLKNFNNLTYTYISSDLNISAGFDITVTAQNESNQTTQNFSSGKWEKPVDINFTLPAIVVDGIALAENKNAITGTLNLGFTHGIKTINSTDINTSKNLIFNFDRTNNSVVNPIQVQGNVITLTASSLYTATSSASIKIVTGTSVADQNATFVYGRAHAPRYRFSDANGTGFIYYEIYCSGTSCDKNLLPGGSNVNWTDDPRWFINSIHSVNSGSVGTVTQKGTSYVFSNSITGINPTSVFLNYNEVKGYPYKATMEYNASSWLIYNKYNPTVVTNEFEVEFVKSGTWAGKHETNTTTTTEAFSQTNRRLMW